jgi:hypothetical protein
MRPGAGEGGANGRVETRGCSGGSEPGSGPEPSGCAGLRVPNLRHGFLLGLESPPSTPSGAHPRFPGVLAQPPPPVPPMPWLSLAEWAARTAA